MTEELTNKAVTGNDASFAYQVGKDMVANEMAIKAAEEQIVELGKSAAVLLDSLHTLKITVPAKPDAKFYRINADIELPEEFRNKLCLLIAKGGIEQVQCGADLTFESKAEEQVFYLVKFADEPAAVAVLRASDIKRQKDLPRLMYLYIAKYLTEKYLPSVRAQFPEAKINNSGIVSGAPNSLLDMPFILPEGVHPLMVPGAFQARSEVSYLEIRIQNGEIDPSSAKDFKVE